jgi:rsbT antagonist protein RsbS
MTQRGPIPILRVGSNLLTTIHVDLHDTIAEAFQEDVLVAIKDTGAKGLVIDITGLEEVDTYVARILADTGRMASLMGAQTVLVGMRAEVAATLVRMGFMMENVETALDVDDGLNLLLARKNKRRG